MAGFAVGMPLVGADRERRRFGTPPQPAPAPEAPPQPQQGMTSYGAAPPQAAERQNAYAAAAAPRPEALPQARWQGMTQLAGRPLPNMPQTAPQPQQGMTSYGAASSQAPEQQAARWQGAMATPMGSPAAEIERAQRIRQLTGFGGVY